MARISAISPDSLLCSSVLSREYATVRGCPFSMRWIIAWAEKPVIGLSSTAIILEKDRGQNFQTNKQIISAAAMIAILNPVRLSIGITPFVKFEFMGLFDNMVSCKNSKDKNNPGGSYRRG